MRALWTVTYMCGQDAVVVYVSAESLVSAAMKVAEWIFKERRAMAASAEQAARLIVKIERHAGEIVP